MFEIIGKGYLRREGIANGARGRREERGEGGEPFSPSSRAPRAFLALKIPSPFPFERLSRRLAGVLANKPRY